MLSDFLEGVVMTSNRFVDAPTASGKSESESEIVRDALPRDLKRTATPSGRSQ